MRAGRASRTAEHNALFRALEQVRSDAPHPIVDPFAAAFLGPRYRAIVALARVPLGHAAVLGVLDGRWPGVRSSVVARTRRIDDLVAQCVAGVDQVVLLGAGYDARLHRLDRLRGVPVFEVDHPDTQARKRRCTGSAPGARPDVRYVATDFHDRDLGVALAGAGHDGDRRTLFVWEGVTNYLQEDAVDATLRWCRTAPSGSQLVFTYVDRRVLTDPATFHHADRVLASSRRVGEAVTFGMAPTEMPSYLAERGLHLESDVGAADYRRDYYGAAADRIRGHEFYRVAHASW
jgi:methyltransferase (TIGR00027 family)